MMLEILPQEILCIIIYWVCPHSRKAAHFTDTVEATFNRNAHFESSLLQPSFHFNSSDI